ncbi:MAG TPA: tetratricopeptide repeat protein [Paludibaculum sp.]|jgi:tetratricopeptide (TPR) repeat protein
MSTLILIMAFALQANPDALSASATQLAQQGKIEEAAALWQRAIAAQPGHFPSLFNLGFLRQFQGKNEDASALLARAAKVNPTDFNTRYLHGVVLLKLNRRDAALTEWRAAAAIQPANFKLLQIIAVEYGKGYYYREACDAAQRALKLRNDTPDSWLIAIQACHDARDPGVLELTRGAAEKFPANARTNFEYAYQLRRAGLREESLPFLKKAMEVDAAYEEPYFFYGDSLLLEDRYEEAATHLRAALKIRPDYVPACIALAKALMGQEKLADAAAELQRCSRSNANHAQPHLLLSQIYFRMGKEAEAGREKELSLKLRRAHPELMESPQARPFPAAPAK